MSDWLTQFGALLFLNQRGCQRAEGGDPGRVANAVVLTASDVFLSLGGEQRGAGGQGVASRTMHKTKTLPKK